MIKSCFAPALPAPRNLFLIARLALLLGAITLSNLPAQTLEQRHSPGEYVGYRTIEPGSPRTDVFLSLAQTVGQSIPAKRLVEYIRRTDPSGGGRYWAIVDFDEPSTNKRFYVFDTVSERVDAYYVAHGRGSEGALDDGIADVFSNEPSSNSSSLGIYRALDEYTGNHGRSMRLQGLEPTNSNALERAVVLHKAEYVSESFIRATGRLGRSQGCFAVEPSVGDSLIDNLKNGAYIIAWKTQAQNPR